MAGLITGSTSLCTMAFLPVVGELNKVNRRFVQTHNEELAKLSVINKK